MIFQTHITKGFPHPFRVFSWFCFPHLTDDVLDFTEGQVVFRTMYQLQQGRLTSASWTSQFPEFSFQESSDVATQWQNSMTIKGSPCGVCAISCNCTWVPRRWRHHGENGEGVSTSKDRADLPELYIYFFLKNVDFPW